MEEGGCEGAAHVCVGGEGGVVRGGNQQGPFIRNENMFRP